jgi:hypothetical protein
MTRSPWHQLITVQDSTTHAAGRRSRTSRLEILSRSAAITSFNYSLRRSGRRAVAHPGASAAPRSGAGLNRGGARASRRLSPAQLSRFVRGERTMTLESVEKLAEVLKLKMSSYADLTHRSARRPISRSRAPADSAQFLGESAGLGVERWQLAIVVAAQVIGYERCNADFLAVWAGPW